jgi:hypothetical protein
MSTRKQVDPSVRTPRSAVRFTLRADDVAVEYAATDAPELRLSEDGAERVFTAAELRREPTLLGTLVSATLDSVPDLGDRTVTLAVPDVNLRDGEADVTTFLVRTRHRTSIGGPSLVDGALQVHEPVALTGTAAALPDGAVGACRDWRAIHDLEPPGPGRLRVSARCTVPTPGHRVELRRKEQQSDDPSELLLDKVVHEPDGPVIQLLTDVDAEFRGTTDATLNTVTIWPDGISVPVRRAL